MHSVAICCLPDIMKKFMVPYCTEARIIQRNVAFELKQVKLSKIGHKLHFLVIKWGNILK